MATQEDKKAAWDFALGMIQVDGLEPTPEFKAMVEKEIKGEISDEDLLAYIESNYGAEPEPNPHNHGKDCPGNGEGENPCLCDNCPVWFDCNPEWHPGAVWDEDTQRWI